MYAVCPINDDSEKVKDLLSARDTAGRKLVFSFKGGHAFQGEYRTTPTQTIEANVWQSKYSASEQFVRGLRCRKTFLNSKSGSAQFFSWYETRLLSPILLKEYATSCRFRAGGFLRREVVEGFFLRYLFRRKRHTLVEVEICP